jgi:arginine:agmatine antiporter
MSVQLNAPTPAKSLGVAACSAIVIGNMVGSGYYLSPSAIAPYGLLAILMWMIMGGGALCLGLTFARLATIAPATGGPYAYSRLAYGDFAGFLVAWGYWISIWASLPAIAVAFTGSLFELLPGLHAGRAGAVVVTLAAIWAIVVVNLRGVRTAGLVAEITTYSKLIPFGAIAIVGLYYVEPRNLTEFNPSGEPLMTSAAALAPLMMFAYLGLESATVPAGDVVDPKRTIPRATVLGVSAVALLYVLGTIAVMGLVPRDELTKSAAPFAAAARYMWGSWGAGVVAVGVMISSLGALNGWTLLMGQVPMAAADDQLFPEFLGRRSSRGVPAQAIVLSAVLATALLLVQGSTASGLASFYRIVVGLATMTAVVPYAFCALAVRLVAQATGFRPVPHLTWVDGVAFVFAVFTVYGCGPDAVLAGFLLLLLGVPVYVWRHR